MDCVDVDVWTVLDVDAVIDVDVWTVLDFDYGLC